VQLQAVGVVEASIIREAEIVAGHDGQFSVCNGDARWDISSWEPVETGRTTGDETFGK
jgi:hypothetical protein